MIFRRRYLISICYLFILTVGFAVWQSIPIELSPNIQLPSITIIYNWGRTSPEVMEREITRRVEQAASDLKDVVNVSSETGEGTSSVTLQFPKNINVEFKIIELREKLQQLKSIFPPTLGQPYISKRVPKELEGLQSFISYSLSGNINQYDLLEFARKNIQIPLSGIKGIASIEINGVNEPAIKIEFDLKQIEKYQLSIPDIMNRLYENLKWKSSGYIQQSEKRISIVFPPAVKSLEEIRNSLIQLPESIRQIRLGDIAKVDLTDFPETYIRRINGQKSLTVEFVKETGTDALSLSDLIHNKMEEIKKQLPKELTLQLESDSSEKLNQELSGLENQAIYSITLVFLVLLLFIRQFRAPLIILTTILFSTLLTIIGLDILSISLNMITLAALTVSFGMVVDNAIIVYEHIGIFISGTRQERILNISKDLKKLILPIFGGTLTTIGIFIPLVFALDDLRAFLVPLAVTMSISLLSSVLISLTWIPYALIWLIPEGKSKPVKSKAKKTFNFKLNFQRWLLLFFVIRRKIRWTLLILLILIFGFPFYLIPEPEKKNEESITEKKWYTGVSNFYFENRKLIDLFSGGLGYQFYSKTYFGEPWKWHDQEVLSVTIRTPIGTPIEELNKISKNFEELTKPYQHSISYFETSLSEQYGAYIQYYFKKDYLNSSEPYLLKNDATYLAARTGNSIISVSGFGDGFSSGGSASFNFRITLKGFSYDELQNLSVQLKQKLELNKRVRNVETNKSGFWNREDLYHFSYQPNERILAENRIQKYQLVSLLQSEINPQNTYGQVEFLGKKPYLLAVTNSNNMYKNDFNEQPRKIGSRYFDLKNSGTLTKESVMSSISRENQEYTRYVTFDYIGPYQFGDKFVKKTIDNFPVPVGNKVEYGNSLFKSEESAINLFFILFLSILTVWMIVSALLESWIDPLIVLSAIPFGLIGVMAGVLFHEIAFDRGVIAGMLLIIGVSVNNSILLMDGKHQFRLKKISGYRCWLNVYQDKFRSILITTLTTIGGLVPMILAETGGFWQSMAVVVCWGLLFSTALLFLFIGIWEKKS